MISYEGKIISLIEYYEIANKLKTNDQNQPFIIVTKTLPQGGPINLYFIPEFCYLTQLIENILKDKIFTAKIIKHNKLDPQKRFNKINDFIELIRDFTYLQITQKIKSS